MTKAPDFEGALKAVQLVGSMATPPFRYQVVQAHTGSNSPPVALTLTRWSAWACADAIGGGLKPPARMVVLDMNGLPVDRPDEDER